MRLVRKRVNAREAMRNKPICSIKGCCLRLLFGISFLVNAVLVLLLILKVTIFSFQTPRNFWTLASGRQFAEVDKEVESVNRFRVLSIGENDETMNEETFVVPHGAQFYPIRHKAYCYYSRFPPGRILVHVGKDGFVEHIRFYNDDGRLCEDGVMR